MRFMEVSAVRNVLRILIVLSAIMGLVVVQGVGTNLKTTFGSVQTALK